MGKEFLNYPMCDMQFVKDAHGQEMLLKDGKFQVMMEWEKPYMHACIDALKPSGDVLEIGFGCGYSAARIQTYDPKSHTIIEYHPLVAEKAREWAKDHPHVTIIEDTWQHALENLGIFDAIFFDDYSLESEEQMRSMQQTIDTSSELLQSGQELLNHVKEELPFLTTLKYSAEDLSSFIAMLEKENASPEHLYRFLTELKEREQITSQLFDEALENLIKDGFIRREEISTLARANAPKNPRSGNRLMQFLNVCLKKHMRKGARFSCFLSDPSLTWENQDFFDNIISNPDLEYREELIDVQVPEHCAYYANQKALVIVIEKMS